MLRSIKQHRSEWLYYRIVASYTGFTAYQVYMIMAKKFLLCIDEDGDLAIIKPVCLTVSEHNDYMEQIRKYMYLFGVKLPYPNEDTEYEFITKKIPVKK